jgi:hypothetical protein
MEHAKPMLNNLPRNDLGGKLLRDGDPLQNNRNNLHPSWSICCLGRTSIASGGTIASS